jgi:hypothetical protein
MIDSRSRDFCEGVTGQAGLPSSALIKSEQLRATNFARAGLARRTFQLLEL